MKIVNNRQIVLLLSILLFESFLIRGCGLQCIYITKWFNSGVLNSLGLIIIPYTGVWIEKINKKEGFNE